LSNQQPLNSAAFFIEFILTEWSAAGLNVATATKRGLYTVHENLVVKKISVLVEADVEQLEQS
jgi:mRNA interferase MazF